MATGPSNPDPRAWATRAVQWAPARNGLKYAAHGFARARGRVLEQRHATPEVANIYTASSPKAGSQWMKALFDHPVVRRHTGLFTLPQLDYQRTGRTEFPVGTCVPGIYLSYPEYQRITRRGPRRTIYMFRDPRDLVVSGYFSATVSHRVTNVDEVEHEREVLRTMSFGDGLLHLIDLAGPALEDMRTWIGVDDADVALFHLEDAGGDPRTTVPRILAHAGVRLNEQELETVLHDVSREAIQAADLRQRKPGEESHYRVEQTGFREHFTDAHYAAMERVAPGLVAELGYPE